MKSVITLSALVSILFSTAASADVVLIKKSQLNISESESTHHRYDDNIKSMNHDSDQLADKIMNRDRYIAQESSSISNGLQVKLVHVKR